MDKEKIRPKKWIYLKLNKVKHIYVTEVHNTRYRNATVDKKLSVRPFNYVDENKIKTILYISCIQ